MYLTQSSLLLIWLFVFGDLEPRAYQLQGDDIVFIYENSNPNLEVVVSGNFNRWGKHTEQWLMSFDAVTRSYRLTKPIADIKMEGRSFYEFTFKVDGTMTDASSDADNVIHCVGYGYRYLINL